MQIASYSTHQDTYARENAANKAFCPAAYNCWCPGPTMRQSLLNRMLYMFDLLPTQSSKHVCHGTVCLNRSSEAHMRQTLMECKFLLTNFVSPVHQAANANGASLISSKQKNRRLANTGPRRAILNVGIVLGIFVVKPQIIAIGSHQFPRLLLQKCLCYALCLHIHRRFS